MKNVYKRLVGIIMIFVILVTTAPVTFAALHRRSREFTINGSKYVVVPSETKTIEGKTYYAVVAKSTTSYTYNKATIRLKYLTENTAGMSNVDIPVKVNIVNSTDSSSIDIQSLLNSKFEAFGEYVAPMDTEWVLNTQNNSRIYYTGSVGMPNRSVFTTLYTYDEFTSGTGDTGYVLGELGFFEDLFILNMADTNGKLSNNNPGVNRTNNEESSNNAGGTWVFMTYVSEDFFKTNIIDLDICGNRFLTFLGSYFTKAQMRDAGYTEEQVVSKLGFAAGTKAATGVSLDKTTINVNIGTESKIKAFVFPLYDVVNENVIWSSADASIATVDQNGVVYGKKLGETVVTVTTEDGGFTANCTVKVVEGTEYYVSAESGNDNNDGTINAPFATIQKAVDIMMPGDTVLVRGGTYREKIEFNKSGLSTAPLELSAYGDEEVIVTGTEEIKNWTVDTTVGNYTIYKAYIGQKLNKDSMVFIDNDFATYAKWPNNTGDNNPNRSTYHDATHPGLNDTWLFPTWGFIDSASGIPSGESEYNLYYGTVYDSALPFGEDELVGATMLSFPGKGWYMYKGNITDSAEGSFYIKGTMQFHTYYRPAANNPYYLYGAKCLMDVPYEWYCDDAGYLYIIPPQGIDPNNASVTVNVRDDVIEFNENDYINVDGIDFFAGRLRTENCDNLKLTDISNNYASAGPVFSGDNNILADSTIQHTISTGIMVGGNNNKIVNNLVEYCCSDGTAYAIRLDDSKDAVIAYNTVRFVGSSGIGLNNKGGAVIKYNNISYFSAVCRDNGGMYGGYADGVNTEISYNWTHNGMTDSTAGIYPDNSSIDFIIHHNVGWNIPWGLLINSPRASILLYNNTFEGNSHTSVLGTGVSQNIWSINNLFASGSNLSKNYVNVAGGTYMDGGRFNFSVNESNALKSNSALSAIKANNFYPSASSAVVNQGRVIENITDGYVGSAPDIGAYEYGAEKWIPGHDFSDTSRINEIFEKTEHIPYKNYVQSGGFETELENFSWKTTGNKTAYRQVVIHPDFYENPGVYMGQYGLRLGSNETASGTDGISQTLTLEPNTRYIFSAAGRLVDASGTNPIVMSVTGAKTVDYDSMSINTYKWKERTLTFVTGRNPQVTISFSKNATGYGYIDNVMVYKSTDQSGIEYEESIEPEDILNGGFLAGGTQYILTGTTKEVNGVKYLGVLSTDGVSYTYSKASMHLNYLSEKVAGDANCDIPVSVNIRNTSTGAITDIQNYAPKFSPFNDYLIPSTHQWVLNGNNGSRLYYTGSIGLPGRGDLMNIYARDSLACGEGDVHGFVTGELGFWPNYYYMAMVYPNGTINDANKMVNTNNNSVSAEGAGGTWYFMTYVHENFFKENNIDMQLTGAYAKEVLRKNFSYEEMTGWSEANKDALFFDAYEGDGIGIVVVKTVDAANNKINVKACINNNGDTVVPSGACLVVVAYNGNNLADVKIIPLEEAVAPDSISEIYDPQLDAEGIASDNTVKVMLWNSIVNVKPYTEAVVK